MSDSNPPDAFGTIDTIISAVGTADTEEERRLYLRAAVRNFEILAGQAQARLAALADALTPKRAR
jgi:hypothetical protein